MSGDESTRIDLLALLRAMRGERQPTLIVHGPPLAGKSRFARQVAKQPGVAYLDVLARVSGDPNLVADIEQFDVEHLRRLVVSDAAITGADVLLVDELDFLVPVWGGDLGPFREMVRRLSVPPGSRVAFAFFLQSRDELDDWDLATAGRQRRVLSFEDLRAAPRAMPPAIKHKEVVGS